MGVQGIHPWLRSRSLPIWSLRRTRSPGGFAEGDRGRGRSRTSSKVGRGPGRDREAGGSLDRWAASPSAGKAASQWAGPSEAGRRARHTSLGAVVRPGCPRSGPAGPCTRGRAEVGLPPASDLPCGRGSPRSGAAGQRPVRIADVGTLKGEARAFGPSRRRRPRPWAHYQRLGHRANSRRLHPGGEGVNSRKPKAEGRGAPFRKRPPHQKQGVRKKTGPSGGSSCKASVSLGRSSDLIEGGSKFSASFGDVAIVPVHDGRGRVSEQGGDDNVGDAAD